MNKRKKMTFLIISNTAVLKYVFKYTVCQCMNTHVREYRYVVCVIRPGFKARHMALHKACWIACIFLVHCIWLNLASPNYWEASPIFISPRAPLGDSEQ